MTINWYTSLIHRLSEHAYKTFKERFPEDEPRWKIICYRKNEATKDSHFDSKSNQTIRNYNESWRRTIEDEKGVHSDLVTIPEHEEIHKKKVYTQVTKRDEAGKRVGKPKMEFEYVEETIVRESVHLPSSLNEDDVQIVLRFTEPQMIDMIRITNQGIRNDKLMLYNQALNINGLSLVDNLMLKNHEHNEQELIHFLTSQNTENSKVLLSQIKPFTGLPDESQVLRDKITKLKGEISHLMQTHISFKSSIISEISEIKDIHTVESTRIKEEIKKVIAVVIPKILSKELDKIAYRHSTDLLELSSKKDLELHHLDEKYQSEITAYKSGVMEKIKKLESLDDEEMKIVEKAERILGKRVTMKELVEKHLDNQIKLNDLMSTCAPLFREIKSLDFDKSKKEIGFIKTLKLFILYLVEQYNITSDDDGIDSDY